MEKQEATWKSKDGKQSAKLQASTMILLIKTARFIYRYLLQYVCTGMHESPNLDGQAFT
jgi:hypothetical protein